MSAATVTIADLASTLDATVLDAAVLDPAVPDPAGEAVRSDALSAPPLVSVNDLSEPVLSVTHDSRRVVPATLFCCIPGATSDGHEFAADAVAAGAVALLVERRIDPSTLPHPVPQLQVGDVRSAMAPAAALVFGHPAQQLRTVGVTGTNGKTTVVSTIRHVLDSAGREVRAIGTLTGARTTPEAPDLQAQLADMVASGVTDVAMEVSSHALVLHRVDAMVFDVAVFTNLGEDHLDFHETPEAYFAAKAMLFEPEHARRGIIDVDDVHGRLLIDAAPAGHPMTAVSVSDAEPVRSTIAGSSFQWRDRTVTYPLPGRHNVANALLAAEACAALGVDDDQIVAALAQMPVVPGRFESVEVGQDFAVVVDYAHTPDALEAVLGTARDLTEGAVIVVFGCGGDRDTTKRPHMGRVASELADVVVITSDNPRSENPLHIIEAIRSGCAGEPLVVADRRAALHAALVSARQGDVVVIAGKGHEQGQDVGGVLTPFDDRVVAAEVLAELASSQSGNIPGGLT